MSSQAIKALEHTLASTQEQLLSACCAQLSNRLSAGTHELALRPALENMLPAAALPAAALPAPVNTCDMRGHLSWPRHQAGSARLAALRAHLYLVE